MTGALARETRTIPIVFTSVSDPIGSGFAASLAHPGGNITGFMANDPALGGKWVELLKEIAPRTVRVALLFNPATAVPLQYFMPSIQAAASSLAIQISNAPVQAKDEIEGVIAAQARNPGGGLMTYGPDYVEQFRQVPEYINRILKGEKPADLPIQAPTKFELVINLKAAKTLDLDVPPLLLGRADDVIE